MITTLSHIVTAVVVFSAFVSSPFLMRQQFLKFLDASAMVDVILHLLLAAFAFGVFAAESVVFAIQLIHAI